MVKNLPAHKLARVATNGALTSVPTTIYGIQVVPETSATWASFFNNADGSGTPLFDVYAYTTSVFVDFSNLGPLYFNSKCYVKITSADSAGRAYIFYD